MRDTRVGEPIRRSAGSLAPASRYAAPSIGARLRVRGRPQVRVLVARLVPWILQLAGLGLWLQALPSIDVAGMTDLGLPSVLPPVAFGALALVAVAFALGVTQRGRPWALLATNLGILAFMLFALPALSYDAPRFAITYVHAGFVEAIARTGDVFPILDARFEWPLLFVLVAFVAEVAGFDPLAVANWVPLLSNLLYLGPLWILVRTATADRRLAWLSLWLFLVLNWIGQDYLSPQGFNLLLYMTVLAIVVGWFRPHAQERGWMDQVWALGQRIANAGRRRVEGVMRPRVRRRLRLPGADAAPARIPVRLRRQDLGGLVVVVVLVFTASAASHQLTPIVTVASVAALVAFHRLTLRTLPVVLGLISLAWMSYMAVTYLNGHLTVILRELGQADVVAGTAVGARLEGSPEHVTIVYLRLAATLGAWLLAAFGVLRRLQAGTWDLTFVLLAAVPFGAIALQSYGGEILLRIYLFSLPFVALLAAAAFLPRPVRARRPTRLALALALAALVVLLPFTRYGNERADWISADEYAASRRMYAEVPTGSLIVTANYNAPIRDRGVELYTYRTIGTEVVTRDVDRIIEALVATDAPESYLFLTRSQRATAELFSGLPEGAWPGLLDRLAAREELDVVFETDHAILYRLDRQARAA